MRTRVYIDGFNLYYGCLKGTPHKWLDPFALCSALLPRNQVEHVRYFTARISARPNDPDQAVRQQTYLRALATVPEITVHLGHFLTHEVTMPDAVAWTAGRYRGVQVIKTEEKGSDVNLATHLLMDAFDDAFDMAVVVSNDSDLKEPMALVRNRFKKGVGILNPQQNVSRALQPLAHFIKPIRSGALAAAQFPAQLTDSAGVFQKPVRW
ncbi:NYN domain-containing protein [Brevundimonas sp. VNH65]|uniref:NYN domain-containing protein n=1 Tax=Brevundimonas sp. VNH65 TaxID=3400917 RepID=UPI003C057077